MRRFPSATAVLMRVLGTGCVLAASSRAQVVIDMTQAPATRQVLPGQATTVWSYAGTVVSGPPGTLVPIAGSYLGPTIHVAQGQNLSLDLTNQIGQASITHWHGLEVPAAMDGYPTATIPDGATFSYAYPVRNRAGTYWYHPHTDMATGIQVQMGLAGFLIVHDAEEAALDLPADPYDVPLCIQDRKFDASNQFVYDPDTLNGFFGDTILVNGIANYVHATATRVHRLRLLNGSASRIYKLAFSDGTPMIVIGTDGGLLAVPVTYPYVMLSPGERVDVWADFRNKPVGAQITLQSLPFSAGAYQGQPLDLMSFSIIRLEPETKVLPATLSKFAVYREQDAVNAASPKDYPIVFQMGMFTLNGGMFDETVVAPNEVAQVGALELIRVTNTAALAVAHPIHFHGRQFQVLDRVVNATGQADWNTVKDGFVDAGWKDTFMIMPGETVRILLRYGDDAGKYVYHCHNLRHEDMGMMRNFRLDLRLYDYLAGEPLVAGSGNRVRAFTAAGTATATDFMAYASGSYGTNVAAGYVDGTLHEEILTGPGPGPVHGPQVRGFDRDGNPTAKINYYAYGTLRYGVNVASAGVDPDFFDEILTGAGPGPIFGPHVRGWSYDATSITAIAKLSYFAYGTLRYGVNVSGGSVDADRYEEIVTAPGPGAIFAPQVRGFDFDATAVTAIAKINFNAFATPQYGANVASATFDDDMFAEIACAPGPGGTGSFPARFVGFDFDGVAIGPLPGFDVTPYTTLYGGRIGAGYVDQDGQEDLVAAEAPIPRRLDRGRVLLRRVCARGDPPGITAFPSGTGANATAAELGF
ncbi:MAG: multicopper oxidase domain-containing protein [Acidobacteriota bacterium]